VAVVAQVEQHLMLVLVWLAVQVAVAVVVAQRLVALLAVEKATTAVRQSLEM
jgi:hypothetical protein